jgi:hypothetical protein
MIDDEVAASYVAETEMVVRAAMARRTALTKGRFEGDLDPRVGGCLVQPAVIAATVLAMAIGEHSNHDRDLFDVLSRIAEALEARKP